MKNIVVLTGAGISAESGLKTFRDSDGLWNNQSIYEVATPEAWWRNKQLVLDFYNHRRRELNNTSPNISHTELVNLESKFHVTIITQNVDDLHERAGSTNILHLHGQLTLARGEFSEDSVVSIQYSDIQIGDKHKNGEQLRPHIVWFGEDVPEIMNAESICESANILIIIGTTLQVYPAAGLVHSIPSYAEVFLIDPKAEEVSLENPLTLIKEKAGTGVPALVKKLLNENTSAPH
jgi:NAD-dependent deacetylase